MTVDKTIEFQDVDGGQAYQDGKRDERERMGVQHGMRGFGRRKTKSNLALGERRVARVLEFVGARLLLGGRLVAFVNVLLERL